MNRSRPSIRRATVSLAGILTVAVGVASLTAGCSISVEQQPRPITRETTVPASPDGN
jgi:hypothetical protein